MKILLISDIHSEFFKGGNTPTFPPLPEFDVVVAAGDIGVGLAGMKWLDETFTKFGKPVLYVPGNHEYYRHDYETLKVDMAIAVSIYNVTLLNPGTVTIDGWKFIGANLWSDLELKGYPPLQQWDLNGFADFEVIQDGNGYMSMARMKQIHAEEKAFLVSELEAGIDRVPGLGIDVGNQKTIVITHFIPSQICIAPKWANNRYNPYFTNDLDDLFDRFGYPLHLYGHTHDRGDVIHPYDTRLVANPLGYPNENAAPYEWKVIEV